MIQRTRLTDTANLGRLAGPRERHRKQIAIDAMHVVTPFSSVVPLVPMDSKEPTSQYGIPWKDNGLITSRVITVVRTLTFLGGSLCVFWSWCV